MRCSLGIVGSELMLPGFSDTHFSYIKEKLWIYNIKVNSATYIEDDINSIKNFLNFSFKNSEFVILTGGLGPTEDDVTKDAVALFLKTNLTYNSKIEKKILEKFSKMGKKPPENSFKQALIIKGAQLIQNQVGIAPGQFIEIDERKILLLPGPPDELKNVFENFLKKFGNNFKSKIITSRYKLAEVVEPEVDEFLSRIKEKIKNVNYTILSKSGDIEVIASANNFETLKEFEDELRKKFKREFYSTKGEKLEDVVSNILKKRNLTISCAESCTGGYLSKTLTDIPGSSAYFLGSIVAYNNRIKIENLGIDKNAIEKYGAVSSQVAILMAIKIKERFKSDIGVGITGIAGPSGGTKEKPVGTVYIAVSRNKKVKVKKFLISGNRNRIRFGTVMRALNMVRKSLIEEKN